MATKKTSKRPTRGKTLKQGKTLEKKQPLDVWKLPQGATGTLQFQS